MEIQKGQVVRATDWPGCKGRRYLVTEITTQPRSGEVAYLLQFDGGTPVKFSAIPVANLRVDAKATRERARRMAATGRA